jgi:hypothetical protein
MKDIINDNRDKHVSEIFTALLHGIVDHHKGDKEGTNAYISLVTSPIPEIHTFLTKHMLHFNTWLSQSLEQALKASYPSISESDIDRTVKKYVLIGNGVFWGINLYEGENFNEQVELGIELLKSILVQLDEQYSEGS